MSENITMIVNQYIGAIKKHPFFCNLIPKNSCGYGQQLKGKRSMIKGLIEDDDISAEDLLHCEVLEAMEAYLKGNYRHCLQELAQCGAVILRMMDMVRTEMEKEVTP